MKKCSKCGVFKECSEFGKRGRGFFATCKTCTNAKNKAWRLANPEKFKEMNSRAREKRKITHPDAQRLAVRKYRAKDVEAARQRGRKASRKMWAANPQLCRAKAKAYRDQNLDKINAYRRARRAANPEPTRAACRKAAKKRVALDRVYRREKYHSDRQFKLVTNLRNRVRGALTASRTRKTIRTLDLLGCPPVWLEAWLESLFKPGMTWENHGPVWHIDHLKPCAAFDLTDPEQQKICFHWSNHQPLFVAENLQKSDTYAD